MKAIGPALPELDGGRAEKPASPVIRSGYHIPEFRVQPGIAEVQVLSVGDYLALA
jgi:hypothetical protein